MCFHHVGEFMGEREAKVRGEKALRFKKREKLGEEE
jgi:hypothetical protein